MGRRLGRVVADGATRLTRGQRGEPEQFSFGVGGWFPRFPNNYHWVEGQLRYVLPASPPGSYAAVTPAPEQWQAFWRLCDDLDVWSWPVTVGRYQLMDWPVWSMRLKVGWYAAETCAYFGADDVLRGIERLRRALEEMIGWKPED